MVERIMTIFLNTEIIPKECITRPKKFIFEGPKYLDPLIDGIDVRSLIAFTTELE